MQKPEQKFKLRFFFDYGAGGCLWAGNDLAREKFGYGPIDADLFDVKTRDILSPASLALPKELKDKIAVLSDEEATHLNQLYPPDPSLWRQEQCDQFNYKIEDLLALLIEYLADDFDIVDKQYRLVEDPDLDEYLANPSGFSRK